MPEAIEFDQKSMLMNWVEYVEMWKCENVFKSDSINRYSKFGAVSLY